MPTAEDRSAAIAAMGVHIGEEAAATLDQLLPQRPWWEYVPAEVLMRYEVAIASEPAARHSLYCALAERIGHDHAGVLLAFLLPVPARVLLAQGVDLSG